MVLPAYFLIRALVSSDLLASISLRTSSRGLTFLIETVSFFREKVIRSPRFKPRNSRTLFGREIWPDLVMVVV